MITEDYVSFEIAKMLKESDFRVCTKSFYKKNILHHNTCALGYYAADSATLPAPTLQMTMKWLREVHKLIITIDYDKYSLGIEEDEDVIGFGYNIQTEDNPEEFFTTSGNVYNSYEEAVEEAIKNCLHWLEKQDTLSQLTEEEED